MFLSIFAATCRPNNVAPFLDNLRDTCDDPSSFEVLFKLDEGADDLIAIIEEYKKTSPFTIKYLATAKLGGYYTLDVGYNELLKIVHPESYFCWLLTDEIRFETKGWDAILKKYVGFFPDDIFRIKLSIFQLKNYTDMFECLPCPDNYAVTTRRWLEIAGGWGNFWGPDSWHQCVDYYLCLSKNEFNPFGIWRSIPIYDIRVEGQEAGQGIEDPVKLKERIRRIWEGWQQHSTHTAQENYNRIAQRLNAHIYAVGMNLEQYIIRENFSAKKIEVLSGDGTYYHGWKYSLPRFYIKLMSGHKHLSLPHLFPRLYLHRAKILNVLFFCRRSLLKIRRLFNLSFRLVYFLSIRMASIILSTFIKFSIWIISPALRKISYNCTNLVNKAIVTILSIPIYINRGIEAYLFRGRTSSRIQQKVSSVLASPLKIYKQVACFIGEITKRITLGIGGALIRLSAKLNCLASLAHKPLHLSFKRRVVAVDYLFDGRSLQLISANKESE